MPDSVRPLHENWVEALAAVARALPGGGVHRVGDLVIVRSGLKVATFNVALALEPLGTTRGVEEAIQRWLVAGATPWTLVTTPANAEALAPAIRSLGLAPVREMPGMVWEPLPSSPPPMPRGLEVRVARTGNDLRTFARTILRGFEAPSAELMDAWAEGAATTARSDPPAQVCYLGYLDGQPAATCVRVMTADIAGIYGVATVPEFRRRGLGEAMTRWAVHKGRAAGCRRSYLQASAMGRPIYERLGYWTVEEYRIWARPASPVAGADPG